MVDNTYWQSQKDDDMGDRKDDSNQDLEQASWADMTALNAMPQVPLDVKAELTAIDADKQVAIDFIIHLNTSPSSDGQLYRQPKMETKFFQSCMTTTT